MINRRQPDFSRLLNRLGHLIRPEGRDLLRRDLGRRDQAEVQLEFDFRTGARSKGLAFSGDGDVLP